MKVPDRGWNRALGRGAFSCLCLCLLSGSSSCGFLDPTEVENPKATVEDILLSPNPTRGLLPGLRRQYAQSISAVVVATELASDNYATSGTFILGDIDFPREILPTTDLLSAGPIGSYTQLQTLRAQCDFVIEEAAPNDLRAVWCQFADVGVLGGVVWVPGVVTSAALKLLLVDTRGNR